MFCLFTPERWIALQNKCHFWMKESCLKDIDLPNVYDINFIVKVLDTNWTYSANCCNIPRHTRRFNRLDHLFGLAGDFPSVPMVLFSFYFCWENRKEFRNSKREDENVQDPRRKGNISSLRDEHTPNECTLFQQPPLILYIAHEISFTNTISIPSSVEFFFVFLMCAYFELSETAGKK